MRGDAMGQQGTPVGTTHATNGHGLRGRVRELRQSWRPAHYLVVLLVHAPMFVPGAKAGGWDWYDFIYPWADALRLSILKYHQFPWWNPWSMSGQPFFAEPQTAVLAPDTLFLLGFGPVLGYKLVVLFYALVGYEGSRRLCRHLFGATRFVEACSIVPALFPPLALHLGVGHAVLLAFWLFPWLLVFALTWRQSAEQSLAFGVVIGCFFLIYVHYAIIMSFTIVGAIVAVELARSRRSRDTWMKASLVVAAAAAIGLTRIALTVAFVAGFPRLEPAHYPIVASLSEVVTTLVAPLQSRVGRFKIAGLEWWELGSYVGVLALALAYVGFRCGDRRLRWLHVGALVCLVFAWNNRDRFLPGYWMYVTPPWRNMVIGTRWRLFACYFLLLAAVQGLVALHARGRRRTALALALVLVGDLGFHVGYAYLGMFQAEPPPFRAAPDPPRTVLDHPAQVWSDLRMNRVSMGMEVPLLGWSEHYPKREYIGSPSYRGEFVGTEPVVVAYWSPNHVVLAATPGDTVTVNVNPSSYWIVNGERLFASARAIEPELPFRVVVPPNGRVDLVARPPHLHAFVLVQAIAALATLVLFRRLRGMVARGS